ncbi:hypothetical protein HOA55_00775 [archaeon]|jgi:hypothetical protein|nr:hypothetical protein [archaeon]MBT3578211.1 hypothetical protein [archaeon]MBT6819868.1 hypothetical protein [archaeon]MBT6956572.1 hypothetical protein [archaeon]MBT7025650.1 hypothetical protein [archaeon]
MVKSKENLIGAYAFLIGVVLAVILGLFHETLKSALGVFYLVLVVLGLFVGFLNVGDKDSNTFLLASLALVIVSGMGNDTLIFISNLSPILSALSNVLTSLLVLFIPATIIVALKTVFAIAKI